MQLTVRKTLHLGRLDQIGSEPRIWLMPLDSDNNRSEVVADS